MNAQLQEQAGIPSPAASGDERLVSECLRGNEQAWAALIHKYKNLIFSIPIKYGASREDAADLFQAVCLELFSELANLRKTGSLRSWLITVTTHKAFHWKKKHRRRADREVENGESDDLVAVPAVAPEFIQALEREQMVREALSRLPVRCGELVRLLFYEHPPMPYSEVAQRLGVATGSIGFIRGRCLKKLQKLLEDAGF